MTKRKVCKKGNSCGLSCISATKVCRKELSAAIGSFLDTATSSSAISDKQVEDFMELSNLLRGHKIESDEVEGVLGDIKAGKEDSLLPAWKTLQPKLEEYQALRKSMGKGGMKAVVAYRQRKVREYLVNELGEETVAKAEANLSTAMKGAFVRVRTQEKGLEGIVKDGEFKNSFELGNSRGAWHAAILARTEEEGIGVEQGSNGSARPVYGSLQSAKSRDDSSFFGDYALELKPSVKETATFTGDDSLVARGAYVASSVNKPSLASLMQTYSFDPIPPSGKSAALNSIKKLAAVKDPDIANLRGIVGNSYFEAQLGRPVRASDIARISIPKGTEVSKKVADWAKKNNVEIITE